MLVQQQEAAEEGRDDDDEELDALRARLASVRS